jgi:hypothetical protein
MLLINLERKNTVHSRTALLHQLQQTVIDNALQASQLLLKLHQLLLLPLPPLLLLTQLVLLHLLLLQV